MNKSSSIHTNSLDKGVTQGVRTKRRAQKYTLGDTSLLEAISSTKFQIRKHLNLDFVSEMIFRLK